MMFKRFVSIPFLLSYCLFPMSVQFGVIYNYTIDRNWIDIGWGALALFAALVVARKYSVDQKLHVNSQMYMLFVIFLTAYLLRFSVPLIYSSDVQWLPLAMEVKPLFYFLVALLIPCAFRQIDDLLFVKYGCVLAIILLVEVLIRSFLAGTLVRPFGSGEVNYDAALLVIALVIAYTSKQRISRFQMSLIWLGLLFTFSRTSVVAAAVIHLWVRRTHRSSWVIMLLVSFSFVLSFLLRDLSVTDVESIDRYLMWMTAIDFVTSDYLHSAFGFFPGNGLMNIDVPSGLQWLWDSQGDMLGISGVYAFYFHSALLRLTLTWGWVIVMTAFILSLYMILSSKISIRLQLLILSTVLLSLTMGVFYLSNVGVIWWLAVLSVPKLIRSCNDVEPLERLICAK